MEHLKSSNLVNDQQVQKAIKENSINARQPTIKAAKKLTFPEFSKKLEYRRNSVYFRGKQLFRKVSNDMNLLNEKLFYSLFIAGQLNY